jgi:hypothetical protein
MTEQRVFIQPDNNSAEHLSLSGIVSDGNGHILNAIHNTSRISGTEHNQIQESICANSRASSIEHSQIQNRMCDAEGKILGSVSESSRDNL